MAKNTHSLKELSSKDNQTEETHYSKERPPIYRPKSCFHCPLSHNIMWHYGFIYEQCPVVKNQRNTEACNKCVLKEDRATLERNTQKTVQVEEKKRKEAIPKIGKTYTSKE